MHSERFREAVSRLARDYPEHVEAAFSMLYVISCSGVHEREHAVITNTTLKGVKAVLRRAGLPTGIGEEPTEPEPPREPLPPLPDGGGGPPPGR
jgi:hypothetical protein